MIAIPPSILVNLWFICFKLDRLLTGRRNFQAACVTLPPPFSLTLKPHNTSHILCQARFIVINIVVRDYTLSRWSCYGSHFVLVHVCASICLCMSVTMTYACSPGSWVCACHRVQKYIQFQFLSLLLLQLTLFFTFFFLPNSLPLFIVQTKGVYKVNLFFHSDHFLYERLYLPCVC